MGIAAVLPREISRVERRKVLAILARALGLASIELARTVGGAWPLAERL